ncbi:MAG: NAD(P)/FAD-dependent oxidoreductase [Gemmatimonadales bacterium]
MQDRPYWWDTAPRPALDHPHDLPTRTDVAVIGGGYTGVSAARALARHGADVTVLERATLGWGASTRNGGFVLPGFKREAGALVHRLGAVRARDLYDASRAAVRFVEEFIAGDRVDCEYRKAGHLILAYKPSHYAELERTRDVLARAFRHETVLVPRDRMREELGANTYHGALLDPDGGGVNPAKLFWGLVTSARRAGARLIEDVDVRKLQRIPNGFLVFTSSGTVNARHVVVATDGYSGPLVPALRRRVVPVGSYLIATAPLGASVARALIPRDRVVSDTKNLLYYFRISADTRMLFGGRVAFGPTTPLDSARYLYNAMCGLFPRLLGTDIDYRWSGSVAMTMDQLPHAGEHHGVHYAMGYCGHGVALATYLGARLGDTIAAHGDLRPFSEYGFRPVPLYTGTPWFLPLVGAYYRMKDRLS